MPQISRQAMALGKTLRSKSYRWISYSSTSIFLVSTNKALATVQCLRRNSIVAAA
jgi:hypothetical protein